MENHRYEELSVSVISMLEKNGPDVVFSHLDNIIGKTPNFLEAYLVRGELYLETGESQKALDSFEKAIRIDPNEPESYFLRGTLYARIGGGTDKAISDFSKTIELDANHARAYVNRANMYLKKREPQNAISDCTKAIELSPDSVEPYYNRGLAYANTGKFTEALEDYNKVIELASEDTPQYVEAFAKRGMLHSELGNVQDAIHDYERFLELDPNNKMAELVRDALKGLKSGKTSDGGAKPNVALKKARVVMIVGGAIMGVIGVGIGADSGSAGGPVVGVLVGVFLGIGIGPFMTSVKKELADMFRFFTFARNHQGESLKDSILMTLFSLIWKIPKLCIIFCISPFIAIDQLVKLRGEPKEVE